MNGAQWVRLKTLFAEARGLDAGARAAFVRAQCGRDDALRDELTSMLDAHDCDDAFLQPPDRETLQSAAGLATQSWPAGMRVGCYEMIRPLATGGMGEIYLARRADEEFEKQVAVKIIRRSVATVGMMQRFHRERQLLANLDHPNISRLLDGGTTEEGLPYLVMEYIEGRPIVRYCDENDLGLRERLELFATTCRAVQFAHQNLIVHRDIKPNNILVTDAGEAKLLDFGISRLLEDEALPACSRTTITRVSALTPEYSSPEQIRGEPVTTASDVYSLGVVLYELLSGNRPHVIEDLPRYEAERVICEDVTAPPSLAVRISGGAQADRLRRRLKGDLDTIVLTALQKDVSRRYASVQQLADDVHRYLDGLPVAARKDGVWYRTGKFIRRNKPQVAGAAVAVGALVVSLVSVTLSLLDAEEARGLAMRGRSAAVAAQGEAQGVADFMEDLLGSASPFRHGRGVTVLDLLSDAEDLIDARLEDRPGVEAHVRMALARTNRNLLRYADAIPHWRKALDYFRAARGADDPVIAECLSALAQSIAEQSFWGKQDSAGVVAMQREALAIRRKQFGPEHPVVANNLRTLAIAMWAEVHPAVPGDEIVGVLRDSLAMYERLALGESLEAALCRVDLANAHATRGEVSEADARYAEALRLYGDRPAGRERFVLDALDKYAGFLARCGRMKEAAAKLETYRELAPKDVAPAMTKDAVWKLASMRFALGELDKARATLRDAMMMECEALSEAHPESANALGEARGRLKSLADGDDAAEVFGDALVAIVAVGGDEVGLTRDQIHVVGYGVLDHWGPAAARGVLEKLDRSWGSGAVPADAVVATIRGLREAVSLRESSLADRGRTVDSSVER